MKKLKKGQIKSKKANAKIKCDECHRKKRSRSVIRFKGKYICSICMNKHRIGNIDLRLKRVPLEKAINKIYEIKGYKNNRDKSIIATCSFPSVLIGQKIKVIQKQDEKDKNELKKELKKYKIKCVDLMIEIQELRRRKNV